MFLAWIFSYCVSLRYLGILTLTSSGSSSNHLLAFMVKYSTRGSSHSSPAYHISRSMIFALIRNGARNTIGSNSLAIFLRNARLVSSQLLFGDTFALNAKISFLASYNSSRVFADGKCSLSRLPSVGLSSGGIFSRTADELHSHLGA